MSDAGSPSRPRRAVIIGAGPAGLTAAWELLERTSFEPLILERSAAMGGISRTVEYHGNRLDIGGHRFFSKSDRVMDWWLRFLPLQATASGAETIAYQQRQREIQGDATGPDPEREERVMLLRRRRSRIYYLRQFFDYPISLAPKTLRQLGLTRTLRIGLSYLRAAAFPIRPEANLEEFFVNRFGRELYATFFRDYTEKVWGVPCRQISAAWGAQRVKGLSITSAVAHFLRQLVRPERGVGQKATETSLIEQFLYPKLGPGQMWETVAAAIRARGGEIRTGHEVVGLRRVGQRLTSVITRDAQGQQHEFEADIVFSTMPVRDLVAGLDPPPPAPAREIAAGLVYRDFITVGLLVDGLRIGEGNDPASRLPRDNWIYVQEPDVRVGRLQIFNNWSPYMVADPTKVWIGLEYFCDEGDDLWQMSDEALVRLGVDELARIDVLDPAAVRDGTVVRVEKTYPAYFGSYERFDELRTWLDGLENLFLVGRNGMHRYNNQDHSMLTAMVAVDNLVAGRTDKANLWEVNAEEAYHEEK